jgi:hypothetical protein
MCQKRTGLLLQGQFSIVQCRCILFVLLWRAKKPLWTYGIQLWGTASTSNIEILERFQSKALRMIVDAPWYVPNTVIRSDLQTSTVKEEIRR